MLFFAQISSSHQDDTTRLVRDPKLNLYLLLLLEGTTQGSSEFPHASKWKISFILMDYNSHRSWTCRLQRTWVHDHPLCSVHLGRTRLVEINKYVNVTATQKNHHQQKKFRTLIFTFNPLLWDRPDTPKSVYIG